MEREIFLAIFQSKFRKKLLRNHAMKFAYFENLYDQIMKTIIIHKSIKNLWNLYKNRVLWLKIARIESEGFQSPDR